MQEQEGEVRETSDWIVPRACTGEASLDDRVLYLHGGVYIYYKPGDMYIRPFSTRLAAVSEVEWSGCLQSTQCWCTT
jgi:hypothetical protein